MTYVIGNYCSYAIQKW